MRGDTIRRIIGAYDDRVVRAYCWARFGILRQRFLFLPYPHVLYVCIRKAPA